MISYRYFSTELSAFPLVTFLLIIPNTKIFFFNTCLGARHIASVVSSDYFIMTKSWGVETKVLFGIFGKI
jgi:hypothetical protein